MIKAKEVVMSYKQGKEKIPVLKKVSFDISAGRLTMFIGPSGAGKTSLLKLLAKLHEFDEGNCLFEGKMIQGMGAGERASNIGFVLQQFHLFPHMTVLENCMHPIMHVLGLSKSEALVRAKVSLNRLNIGEYADCYPNRLSGGQQQRAAIARALGLKPKVLLFDEPTSALDPESKKCFEMVLNDLLEQGITIAISSHDMPFVRKNIDRVYFLESGMIVEFYDKQVHSIEYTSKIKQFLQGDT